MSHSPALHFVSQAQRHFGWNRDLEPVLTVRPGEVVEVDTVDAGGGQLDASSTVADVGRFDFSGINPTFGPIFVEGAEPGDALKVVILDLKTADWGWTANIPGFGLLADRFPEAALHIWRLDPATDAPTAFGPGGVVPVRPFPGIMGNALPEPGVHSVVNPRAYGGNMDTRDMTVGAEVLLPVGVPGALFSCGDGHAAQGDGEICGTAIETPMRMTLRLDLVKGAGLRFPRFTTPGRAACGLGGGGYDVTMAMGPDLLQNARDCVSDMVDKVAAERGMAPVDAYMLCSVCAGLRISEIVDAPNWIVSCYFPRAVFQG